MTTLGDALKAAEEARTGPLTHSVEACLDEATLAKLEALKVSTA